MEQRTLGRTGLQVSLLTFGCGAVGGLMTAGDSADQDRAVAWARDNGINHFDTAPLYGDGASERNLGRALGRDRDGLVVSTKVRVETGHPDDMASQIRASLEASLQRLRQDRVDLLQVHNPVSQAGDSGALTADQVLGDVVPAFARLRDEGKVGFLGFTARGDTDACLQLVRSGNLDAAQIFYNLLVPSAGEAVAAGAPGQDFGRIIDVASDHGVGSIGVRALAGGALSGSSARHPVSMQAVSPIGSGPDFECDVRRALRFSSLVDAAGYASDLVELALRYVITNPRLSTMEIGIATLGQLQVAAAAVGQGPLPLSALQAIRSIQGDIASPTG